jgi:hypothetical protein
MSQVAVVNFCQAIARILSRFSYPISTAELVAPCGYCLLTLSGLFSLGSNKAILNPSDPVSLKSSNHDFAQNVPNNNHRA